MWEVRFNIELFKIEEYKDGYKYFLVFLIRYFFSWKDFSGTITKLDFIKKGIELWFEKRNLENIYQKWKNENQFIWEIRPKKRNQYITLKSLFHKNHTSNYLVYIDKLLIKKITDIKIFRSFCYIVIACRPVKSDYWVKAKEYFYKNPSRLINTIWKDFWWTEKSTMSKRLTKAKEIFPDIFNITNRYTFYQWFMVQLSNLYSIEWVRYKTQKDKKQEWNIWDKEYSGSCIKNKFIKKQTEIFWTKPEKYKWFLKEEYYQDLYLTIKAEVFK